MGYFVDFITFTLGFDTNIAVAAANLVNKYICLESEEGLVCKGMHFYKQSIVYPSGVRILFDGKSQGLGTHVILPGQALNSVHLNFDVFTMIERLKADKVKYNISRVDIALDTDVDFSYFYNKFCRKQFACRYPAKSCRKNVDLDNRGTLYFGKRGSLTMFRIYDKALEQGVEGIWTRIELECRNEACEQAIMALKNGTVGEYFLGHLRFVNERCEDMSRAKTSAKYAEILGNPAGRRKFERKSGDDTLAWFVNQCAPTYKALVRDYGQEYMDKLIENSKVSKKQARERFDIRVLSPYEGCNVKSGEVVKLNPKFTQLCLDMQESNLKGVG